jgi:hypothetical protein
MNGDEMNLFRVHAYAVEPARTLASATAPRGGPVKLDAELQAALEEATRQSQLENGIQVDFRVDPRTRTNEVRDLILRFAFGTASEAAASAAGLADRLARAMDRRSTPCLFIVAVARDDGARRVTFWTFPRDEAFQFRGDSGSPSIQLLTDVFSRTSRLRKAALWTGERRRTDFLRGNVLDFQANQTSREVADFWIDRFLDCTLAIAPDSGTRLLANSLRKTYEATQDAAEREQLHAAITSVRQAPQTRWSLREFADRYLGGDVKERFLNSVANQQVLDSPFDFSRDTFDKTIHFRVFRLETDVYVSSPFDEIGRSVVVQGDRLRAEGIVREEKVRARHA